jgi:hypothetical protein
MTEYEDYKLDFPEGCNDCGVQCRIGKRLAVLHIMKAAGLQSAERMVGNDAVEFETQVRESLPADLSDEEVGGIMTDIRTSTAESLDSLDSEIKAMEQERDGHAMSCDGVLKMRAAKEGIMYTVSVCTSKRVHTLNAEKPTHLPTHVRADTT